MIVDKCVYNLSVKLILNSEYSFIDLKKKSNKPKRMGKMKKGNVRVNDDVCNVFRFHINRCRFFLFVFVHYK